LLAWSDIVTRYKKWGTANKINEFCQFGQFASGGITSTHIFDCNLISAVRQLQSKPNKDSRHDIFPQESGGIQWFPPISGERN
jgi:hypothetical protein